MVVSVSLNTCFFVHVSNKSLFSATYTLALVLLILLTGVNNNQKGLVGGLRWTRHILATGCQALRELLAEQQPPIAILIRLSTDYRLHEVGRFTISDWLHWRLVGRVALRHLPIFRQGHLQSWRLFLQFQVYRICLSER